MTTILPFLEASLLRPLALVVAAWLFLRLFRVQHPASRHAVWTAVLVGMLVLPIVSVVGPRWTLAVLPATQAVESRPVALEQPPVPVPADTAAPSSMPEQTPLSSASTAFVWPSTETLIVAAYLTGVSLLLIYRVLGWLLLRRVLARSRSLRPACLRESSDVVTPVAAGVLRPSVILPAGWRAWNVRTRRAVLAHEFAHLRRRDTLVAALGRFVTSVLWFHPAAWWVSRQTSDLAELACDAVALERVGDPGGYSRVLVEFASAVNRSGARIALPGLAIASGSRMGDRVDQVFLMSTGTMRRLARPRVWLAFGIPLMCLVATVMLGARSAQAPEAPGVKFDVVSIKPCPGLDVVRPPGSGRGANPAAPQITPGYVHWDCVTLATLIDQAWAGGGNGPRGNGLLNVLDRPREDSPKRVRGGPSWVHDERFTIEAKVSGDTTPLTGAARFVLVRDAMLPALRAMIEDRFQLKFRKATEQQSMYAMTVAKSGLKITQTAPQNCWPRPVGLGRGQVATPPPGFEGTPECGINVHGTLDRGVSILEITHANLQDFARYLSSLTDRYVLDKTGVEGRFSFKFEYQPDDNTPGGRVVDRDPGFMTINGVRVAEPPPPPPRTDGVNIFKALEALGLHLEATKGPAEYLQIDSVQRPRPDLPVANATAGSYVGRTFRSGNSGGSAGPPDEPSAEDTVGQASSVAAQQVAAAKADPPKFDVVSIKLCPGLPPPGTGRGQNPRFPAVSPGYALWGCVTLSELANQAYAGEDYPLQNTANRRDPDYGRVIRGGPEWIYSERFTIEVKAGDGADQVTLTGPMLRGMLEDRFQLRLRKATEQQSMYGLTVVKSGLKLTPTAPTDCWVRPAGATPRTPSPPGFEGKNSCGTMRAEFPNGNSSLAITGMTMRGFAQFLSGMMDHYVLDETNVGGMFNIPLEYAPDEHTRKLGPVLSKPGGNPAATSQPATPSGGPTIFKALEQLGLKLESTKGPAEYLQIERVQRPRPDPPSPSALRRGKLGS